MATPTRPTARISAAPAAVPAQVAAQPARARPARISTSAPGLMAASTAAPALRLAPPASAGAVLSGRAFRTHDGKLIELPEGMTAEEAAKLEADALKAQTKLGKGPPPQPVPDVKKQVKKDEKKAPVKPKGGVKAEGRKAGAAKRVPPPPPASLRVGGSKVAQYLAAKGLPVQQRGLTGLRRLRANEQTHEDAHQKLVHSEKAVVNPPEEGQSKSNAGQVDAVAAKPAPAPSEDMGKRKLQASLQENSPKTIEDVDNFKRDMKAQHIGADVLKVVQGDTNAVGATFGDVKTTPPPAPPEQTPQALPAVEGAPATASLALGQGAIAPLEKEHTDVSKYTKEADDKLKEEGVTQEQLDMVDSGDLATANKEKKGMEKTAKTEPQAIQQFAQAENTRVGRELGQEEKKQRGDMAAKRKAGLGATAAKQKGTKSALEKKRDEVAKHINDIYTKAQNSVKKKLADLETASMKRFDDGNAQAAKDFEANVNREIDLFKADRYSGWFGWARRAKDWLLGIDDLPEVKAIFERNRTTFVNTINKLVADITADNKKVIQGCKEELANAKKEIEVYVKGLKPGLQDIGKKAAGEMNAKLAELDEFINKKEEDLQNSLKDKQTAAIKAIDEKIEKMKEAMSGALSKLGKLLLLAAKKFFAWALEKFGYSLSDIQSIIDKGVAVLKAIFTGPIKFVKNLMNAAMLGFEMFRDHFLDHLKRALFEWLTDSLEGIQLPSSWDLRGIISVVLQVVGISYANLRRFLVEELTEPVVAGLEKGASLIATLFREGPMAAWQQLQGMVGELSEAFQAAVKDYIKQRIIIEAVKWVVSLFIPGAGIIKAIIGIYDTIVFFVQKIKEIMKMIANFLSSIGEIAAGNIGAAAKAMEEGLARGLKLVISFLARLLHLSGITNAIKKFISGIKAKVDGVLKKLAHWIAAPLKKVYAVAKAGVQKGVQAAKAWWAQRRGFRNRSGEEHTLSLEPANGQPVLIISSNPKILKAYLDGLPAEVKSSQTVTAIRTRIDQINKLKGDKGNFGENAGAQITRLFGEIVGLLQQISDPADPSLVPSVVKWPEKQPITISTGQTQTLSKQMIADPLTINSGGLQGYAPQYEGPLWLSVRRRGESAYKRGHLLNHHLFGPGNAENLVPITTEHNNWMAKGPEDKAKTKVLSEKKRIRYTVDVVFSGHGTRIHLPDEALVPKTIRFTLREYLGTDKPGAPTGPRGEGSLTTSLPPDKPWDKQKEAFDLWQANAGSKPNAVFKPYSKQDRYKQGDLVLHEKFGKGYVLSVEGNVMTVRFPDPAVPDITVDRRLTHGQA